MNLLKLFNIKYLFQNLKKSAALLAVFMGIIPLLNFIVLLSIGTNSVNNGYVLTMQEISIVNICGFYVVPIILSMCLFSFVFKKKSVDFVNSMPISRASIFVTNTIGGILIITSIMLINIIGFLAISLIFSSLIVAYNMFFDYFLIWTISYIFIFVVANLAMSISGNLVTQLAVTALLLFLIPFLIDYSSNPLSQSSQYKAEITCNSQECQPNNYYCYEDKLCLINKDMGIYEIYLQKQNYIEYTMPYQLISQIFSGNSDNNLFYGLSLVKMFILILIYFVIGLYLFIKRKMEVCETSFKSFAAHSIVKSLTMLPLIIVLYEIINSEGSLTSISICFVILVAYYLIYDLITRKSISHLGLSGLYFICTLILVSAYIAGVNLYNDAYKIELNVNDIKSAAINENNNYYNDYNNSFISNIFVEDKELINAIIKNATYSKWQKDTTDSYYYESEVPYYYETFIIRTKDNQEFLIDVSFNENDYNKVIDLIISNKKYQETVRTYNYNQVMAIKVGDFIVKGQKYQSFLKTIEEIANWDLNHQIGKSDVYGHHEYLTLYSYEKHEVIRKNIDVTLVPRLYELVASFHNEKTKLALKNNLGIPYFYIRVLPTEEFNFQEYSYLLDYASVKINNFAITSSEKEVNLNKEYLVLECWLENSMYYIYSNDIEEFNKIITETREEVKDNEEYKNVIIKPYSEKDVVEVR